MYLTMRVGLVSAFVFAFVCASASAEGVSSESRQVQSIVRNTASPFCPGKTLDSCPSPKAGEWRRDIRAWVADGVPEPDIRDRLQARVPGFELSIPPVKSGWVIPAVAVALSTLWLIVMARRFTRRRASSPAVETPTQALALDARLDEELARFE
jgi:cytochrome c-type biogenesis protein CcmH/NrfF